MHISAALDAHPERAKLAETEATEASYCHESDLDSDTGRRVCRCATKTRVCRSRATVIDHVRLRCPQHSRFLVGIRFAGGCVAGAGCDLRPIGSRAVHDRRRSLACGANGGCRAVGRRLVRHRALRSSLTTGTPATSAPGLSLPLLNPASGLGGTLDRRSAQVGDGADPAADHCTPAARAHAAHRSAPATSAPGLGSPLPHLHWDWARRRHIQC